MNSIISSSNAFDFEKEREFLRSRAEELRFGNNSNTSSLSPTSTLSSCNNKFTWEQAAACNDDFFQLNFDNDDDDDDDDEDNNQEELEPFETMACPVSSMGPTLVRSSDHMNSGFPLGVDTVFESKSISLLNNKSNDSINIDSIPLVYVPSAPLYLNNTHMIVEEGEPKRIIIKLRLFLNKQIGLTFDFSDFNCTWYVTYIQNDDIKHTFEINLFNGKIENTHIMDIRYLEGQRFFFSEFYHKLRTEFIVNENVDTTIIK
jgi:hypothetical protein